MDFRQLGGSGFKVPVLTLGTATFGGGNEFFKAWGTSDVKEATRLVDISLDAGLTMFDTADVYSQGLSEQILGEAIKGRRDKVLISTKGTFRTGDGPNDVGSSRFHLTETINGSLRRLGTDYIDLYQLHGFDALTPIEEALQTLDDFVRQGKIRYIGCSNFSGWHLQKSLNISEKYGLARHVAHQAYYSLVGRDYEWELMPLAVDQKIGTVVWSPLGWGRLTGKYPPRSAVAGKHAQSGEGGEGRRTAGAGRVSVPRGRRDRRSREGDRQDRSADRAQLAAAAADGLDDRDRRAQRRTVEAEPRLHRLEPDTRSGAKLDEASTCATPLSVLASGPVRRAESTACPLVVLMRADS